MQVKRWVIMPRNETGACQGQDACLKHWMNWNCSEKCGFIIKLRNFISCVSLIGDNSHLTFKPRPDSKEKKNKHLSCLWLPLTRLTAFHRNLWSGDGYYGLAVLGSLWKRQALVTEKNTWPFYKWRHCGPERGRDLSRVTQPQSLKIQFSQSG